MGRVSDAKSRLMQAVTELIWTGSYGATTIDLICRKAGVRKGSFYYFFRSKADLAAAALDADWDQRRPQMDAVFSPTVPPMERLRRFCEGVYRRQKDLKTNCGCVLGCPVFILGAEVCTREKQLRAKIEQILGYYRAYLENAIRDAQAVGQVAPSNSPEKARMIFAYYEGLLTQARIANDPEMLRDLPQGIQALLGSTTALAAA